MSDQKNPFLPENFMESGRIPDGVSVILIHAETTRAQYGQSGDQFPCLKIKVRDLADATREYEEEIRAGSLERVEPTGDGKTFIDPTTGQAATIAAGSKMAKFITSVVKADQQGTFRPALASNDAHAMAGLSFVVRRVAEKAMTEGQKDVSVLTCGKYLGYNPGAVTAAPSNKPAAAPAANPSPAADAGQGPIDVESLAAETIVGILLSEGTGVARPAMMKKITDAANAADADPALKTNRSKVTALLANQKFIKSRSAEFAFDGTTFTLPG